MPETHEQMGEFKGMLRGIEKDIREIKEDVRKIQHNDNNKIERISKNESKIEELYRWKEHHIEDNNSTNDAIRTLKEEFQAYKDASRTWNFILLGSVITLLIGVIADIMLR